MESPANHTEIVQTSDDEYRIWKKNAPFFYDTLFTHALVWPTLTVEWLPKRISLAMNKDFTIQKLLIGTHTSENEPNFLETLSLQFPTKTHCAPVDMENMAKKAERIILDQ